MTVFAETTLGAFGRFSSGKPIKPGGIGPYSAYGSNGLIGGAPQAQHLSGVIVGRVGAYCGSVAVSREPFWASDNTIVIEPVQPQDLDFLYYLLLGANLNQHAGGSAQPLVTQTTLKSLTFRLPVSLTRLRIAHILRALDALIEINRRRISLLEKMAQTIYREWFVRFRYPGFENSDLVDSPLGPIPEGWEARALGTLVDVDKGLSYAGAYLTEAGIPMANLKCFRPGGGFRRDGTKPYSGPFKLKHKVAPGDLIVANTDLTQAGSVIGSPAFIPRRGFESGGIISHHLFAVRAPEPAVLPWLYQVFQDDRFRNYARSVASGTTVLGFRPADLLSFQLICPPQAVYRRYDDVAADFARTAEDLNDAAEQLEVIRDLILPRLVSGQIDVSDLDLDSAAVSVA